MREGTKSQGIRIYKVLVDWKWKEMHKYKSTLNIEWTKLKLKIKHWNALVVALCGVFQLYLKQQIPSLL